MQHLLSSDLILVCFSLLLGGLIGTFWERVRHERRGNSPANEPTPTDEG